MDFKPENKIQEILYSYLIGKNYPDKGQFISREKILTNPNISWDFIKIFPELDWSFKYLSENPNIIWNNVVESLSIFKDPKWDYSRLIDRLGIDWDLIQQYPDLDWKYKILAMNLL